MSRDLPDFLIVGAAKAGTTTLYHYLNQHSSIFLPENKEPKFLVHDILGLPQQGKGDRLTYELMVKNLEDYKSLFQPRTKNQICGEASVDYLYYSEQVIPKIKSLIGNPKIIIMLRDPIKRAFSAYNHLIRDLRENMTFEQGLEAEENRIENNYEFIWHYKACGLYYQDVVNYKSSFSDVKIIVFEEFIDNPVKITKEVFKFLGVVENVPLKADKIYNKTGNVRNIRLQKLLKGSPKNKIRKFFKTILNKKSRDFVRYHLEHLNLKPKKEAINTSTIKYLQDYYKADKLKLTEFLNYDFNFWT